MPVVDCVASVPVVRTARVMQLEGMFDVPPAERSERAWKAHLPFEDREWRLGLIVGPSGCGKSTIAKRLFGEAVDRPWDWPDDRSLVDAHPGREGIKEITGLLSSVGFSSPPSWLRPFRCLSNGEQFRASVARTLAESPDLAVIDEFTSVVDRTVARIGSAAVAKAVRRSGRKLVAISCHYDIIDWLDPDWTYEPSTDEFHWRSERRRPPLELEIRRVRHTAWQLFRPHHYLSGELAKQAACFVGFVEGRPAAFSSVLSFPHPKRPSWREHRTVCLSDFQGVGIGNALSEYVMSLFAGRGKPATSNTSNPAMIRHRCRSSLWRMHRAPARSTRSVSRTHARMNATAALGRLIAGFTYVGPARPEDAERFGLNVSRAPATRRPKIAPSRRARRIARASRDTTPAPETAAGRREPTATAPSRKGRPAVPPASPRGARKQRPRPSRSPPPAGDRPAVPARRPAWRRGSQACRDASSIGTDSRLASPRT